jgi:hypothetical protein
MQQPYRGKGGFRARSPNREVFRQSIERSYTAARENANHRSNHPPDEEGIETPSNPAALPRQGRIQSIYPNQEVFDKVSNAVTLQHGKMQTIAVRIEPLHPTRKEQKELSNAAALAQQGQNVKLSRLGRN